MSAANFKNLPLPVLGNLARVTIAHSQRSGNEKVLGSLLFKVLEERYERFGAALLRKNSTDMGTEIKKTDVLRTDIFRGIVKFLHGYEILGGNEARAAEQLLQVVRAQKSVLKMNYSEKSAVLLKFVKEFSSAQNQSLIAELRLTEYFERLREAQTRFDHLTHEKQNALSELRQMEWACRIRPELEVALQNYFGFVDMMRGEADFRDLHFDLVQARLTAAGARRARKAKPKDADPKSEPATVEPSAEAERPAQDVPPKGDEMLMIDEQPERAVEGEPPARNAPSDSEHPNPPEQAGNSYQNDDRDNRLPVNTARRRSKLPPPHIARKRKKKGRF